MATLVSIVIGAGALLLPVVGRAVRAFTIYLTFVTLPSWQAVTVVVIAVITAVLVLLPPSMKGNVVAPKERRVI
jgi:hypothetical protein